MRKLKNLCKNSLTKLNEKKKWLNLFTHRLLLIIDGIVFLNGCNLNETFKNKNIISLVIGALKPGLSFL